MIEQTRLLTLSAAHTLDTVGSRAARKQVTLLVFGVKVTSRATHRLDYILAKSSASHLISIQVLLFSDRKGLGWRSCFCSRVVSPMSRPFLVTTVVQSDPEFSDLEN